MVNSHQWMGCAYHISSNQWPMCGPVPMSGPVVLSPYAGYVSGPVVLSPYAGYVSGPVVLSPYAGYVSGPVPLCRVCDRSCPYAEYVSWSCSPMQGM